MATSPVANGMAGAEQPTSSVGLLGSTRGYFARKILPRFETSVSSGNKSHLQALLHSNTSLHSPNGAEPEKRAEMPPSAWARCTRPLGPAGLRTSVITLVATALGTGLLTLPFAFSSVGIVTGMVMLTAACSLAGLSLAILILSSRYTEVETFAGLLALASGSSSAGILLDAVQVMYCLSAVLALLMFEGDFVPAVIEFVQEAAKPERNMCIIGVACVVWPLVLPSDLASLRYFASLLPYAIAVLAVSVLVQMPQLYIDRPKGSEVTLFGTGSAISQLQSTSIFVFSVMCHVNAVPVGKSLERPSVSRIVKVAAYSNLICWVLYALIGIGGYMSFQSMIQGDFLLGYAADCWPILIARSLLVIVCYVGVPLNLTPCVKALRNLISAVASRGRVPTAEESGLMHAVFASVLLVVATGAALYFRSVATVISVLGGSLATLQMFWLPAYIYWKILYSTQPQGFRVGVMVSMVSVGILGFASVLSHLF